MAGKRTHDAWGDPKPVEETPSTTTESRDASGRRTRTAWGTPIRADESRDEFGRRTRDAWGDPIPESKRRPAAESVKPAPPVAPKPPAKPAATSTTKAVESSKPSGPVAHDHWPGRKCPACGAVTVTRPARPAATESARPGRQRTMITEVHIERNPK
jgi:hypothetical protein